MKYGQSTKIRNDDAIYFEIMQLRQEIIEIGKKRFNLIQKLKNLELKLKKNEK